MRVLPLLSFFATLPLAGQPQRAIPGEPPVPADPVMLVQWLQRGDARASYLLGGAKTPAPADIRLFLVQLDADTELEAVIQVSTPSLSAAHVFDKRGENWHKAASFLSTWQPSTRDADRFITFRELVSSDGSKELFIRQRSGGTETERAAFEVYRMRNGELVPILEYPEFVSQMQHPSGDVVNTVTTARFPEGTPPRVVTRTGAECKVYAWSAAAFRFQEDPKPDPALCR